MIARYNVNHAVPNATVPAKHLAVTNTNYISDIINIRLIVKDHKLLI